MSQSVQERIDTVASLEVGDSVTFTDEKNVEYTGEIVELQRNDDHRDWLVKSTGSTPDSVLELWFDPEGGPTHVQVAFESQESRNVKHIKKHN